ncbi:glycoside hydrolase family protein [Phanerochaete sordida]|uniref:Glycoside hydrolase family protein n=1 Tax=Phanerochaete sordida TaxID=48140 RepID=A0A9P3LC58_9APHY|nr:glycoside hydrolase family protein [Phanerochaete sordida]
MLYPLAWSLALTLLAPPASAHPATLAPDARAVSSSAKAGLAWPANEPSGDIQQFTTTGKVQWFYTFGPAGFASALEFVPMLGSAGQAADWDATIAGTIASLHVTHAMGFSEPDQAAGANLSPAAAAALWQQHIQPLAQQGIVLGSPAPSSAPAGLTWLQQWFALCSGCTVDFVAMHWTGTSATAFIEDVTEFHDVLQKPIWVTEWACEDDNGGDGCSPENVASFMSATQQFMDTTDFVERYAWSGVFGLGFVTDDSIVDANGNINALGEQYIGA